MMFHSSFYENIMFLPLAQVYAPAKSDQPVKLVVPGGASRDFTQITDALDTAIREGFRPQVVLMS